jgi:hypothetical protein
MRWVLGRNAAGDAHCEARSGCRFMAGVLLLLCTLVTASADPASEGPDLKALFRNPPASASPWVFWYWMQGNVSREEITADLEAMKGAGLGGAYLMPIQGPKEPLLMTEQP